jgi:hypothetical protein
MPGYRCFSGWAPFLARYGLTSAELKDARDLEAMYLTHAAPKTLGRGNGTHCLVKAISAGR